MNPRFILHAWSVELAYSIGGGVRAQVEIGDPPGEHVITCMLGRMVGGELVRHEILTASRDRDVWYPLQTSDRRIDSEDELREWLRVLTDEFRQRARGAMGLETAAA